jgi:hypothetical protein
MPFARVCVCLCGRLVALVDRPVMVTIPRGSFQTPSSSRLAAFASLSCFHLSPCSFVSVVSVGVALRPAFGLCALNRMQC